ncbi:MAG TPA: DinB family protein [Symbiobacteriaceae bacterium]|nr:DinB family protein [Symbiobacteriaceae bacterium]
MIHDRISLIRTLREYSWDKVGWFVPLAEALEGLTAVEAAWQPPGGGNTIWQTVNHLNFYNEQYLARLTNQPFEAKIETNDDTFGAPGDPADSAGWQATLERTRRVAEGLNQFFAAASDADLDQPTGNGNRTRVEGLVAWIMHDAYHTGQIALLRKQQAWKGHKWE